MEKAYTVAEIRDALTGLFPTAFKKLELEQDEEENVFYFEIEFVKEVDELITPDGVFFGYIDFKQRFVEGVIEAISFMEFVKENK